MEHPMSELNDLSRSPTSLEQDKTIIAVIEMSQSSWLVAGIVPGIERHPLKKLEPSEEELVRLLMRWRTEATKNGHTITRIAVAFEAGRDGFWLARWLRARDIETYVIHPTSVAVSREHRRAKTDRLDTGLLKRVFIGWLRGEPDHCHMAAIPTLAEEDAKRPNREREGLVRERTRIVNRMKSCLARFGIRNFKPTLRKAPERLATLATPEGVPLPPNTLLELRRDMARLRFVMDQIKEVEEARAQRLEQAPQEKTHAMVRLIARVTRVTQNSIQLRGLLHGAGAIAPQHLLRVVQGAPRAGVDSGRPRLLADGSDRLHGLRAGLGPDELLGGDRHHQPVLGYSHRRRRHRDLVVGRLRGRQSDAQPILSRPDLD
jgi:transposase